MKISNREHPFVFSASDWVATRDERQGLGSVSGMPAMGLGKERLLSRRG